MARLTCLELTLFRSWLDERATLTVFYRSGAIAVLSALLRADERRLLRHRRARARPALRRRACIGSRLCLHKPRAKRCASTPKSASEKLNGSSPKSTKRVTVSGALFVCRVDRSFSAAKAGLHCGARMTR
jgi:hypothetical protein